MTIFIPTPLRPYAEGKDAVEVNAATIADALDALTRTHPALQKHLFTGDGKLRAFVNLYFNDEDVRYLPAKERTEISATDTLSIIPSIAGGRPDSEALVPGAPPERPTLDGGHHARALRQSPPHKVKDEPRILLEDLE